MADNSEKSVLERVTGVIEEVLKVDAGKVTPTSDIRNDLGADSLDLMTLIVALEEEFDGKISDDEVANIKTVEDAVNLIQNQVVKSE